MKLGSIELPELRGFILNPAKSDKANADRFIAMARRRGILRNGPCSSCGATDHIDAHHEDYKKPRVITWLCRSCHLQRHAKLGWGSASRAKQAGGPMFGFRLGEEGAARLRRASTITQLPPGTIARLAVTPFVDRILKQGFLHVGKPRSRKEARRK